LFLTNTTITVPGFGNVIPTNEITIEFWQRASTSNNVNAFVLTPDNNANACRAYVPLVDHKIYWAFGNTSGGGQLSYSQPPLMVGSWQHFAFVASQSGNYMAIYRNGVLEAQKTGMTPLTAGNRSLVFGGLAVNEDWDEVRIWSVARSADQILTNMNRSLAGNEPGLFAYWRYDEGSGTNAFDSSTGNFSSGITHPIWEKSTAPIFVPGVSALPIYGVMDTGAALSGATMSSGQNTACWFNYGTSTNYGSATPRTTIPGTNLAPVFLTNFITGLATGMVYHCQFMATNASGTNATSDLAFTTFYPYVSFIKPTSATLNCNVPRINESIGVIFQYGLTTNYGTTTTRQYVPGYEGYNAFWSANGLTPATTYHYRIAVTNIFGTNYGADYSFTTLSNNNASLSSLTTGAGVGPLMPPFATATASYNAAVSNGFTSVTVIPVTTDTNATVQVSVNGGAFSPVTSGNPSSPLSVSAGQNVINVLVTAQNNVTTKSYLLNAFVDTNSVRVITTAPSGPGSLDSAIIQANLFGTPHLITLASNAVYSFTNADNYWYGPNALPPVAADITIEGNGALLQRSTTQGLRFFYVGADPANPATTNFNSPGPGKLTLRRLTLKSGLSAGGAGGGGGAGMGGAIFNQGTLVLDSVTLANNSAQGGAGGGYGFYSVGANGGGLGGNGASVFPAGSSGGAYNNYGGGGGGGFMPTDNGGTSGGGGVADGLGGAGGCSWAAGSNPGGAGPSGHGSGGGGGAFLVNASGTGGAFGMTGLAAFNFGGGGGGGGVGGGGGGGQYSPSGQIGDGFGGGGGGGFGGGGGNGAAVWMEQDGAGYLTAGGAAGNGGFGGGAGGYANGTGAIGGFGGGNGTGNLADGGAGGAGMGGALFNHGGTVTLINSTVANNNANGGAGGSLYSNSGGAGMGGAIFNLNGKLYLTNSTLAANSTSGTFGNGGGAIYNLAYDSATAQTTAAVLVNSVFGANSGGVDVVNDQPTSTSAGTNLSTATLTATEPNIVQQFLNTGGTANSSGIIATNPALGPLAYNGGPTPTMALLPGSPAANAGDAALAPPIDQRGAPRPNGSNSDLGAVQLQAGSAPAVLTGITFPGPGQLQLQFTGNTGAGYTVLMSTNVSLALSNWTIAGSATQLSPGLFQFTTPLPSNSSSLFFRLRQP
jgi:hypothetical protein